MNDTMITPDMTVNQVIQAYPQTIPVFNQYGIDSCCGGGVAIALAAERDGVAPAVLLEKLNNAVRAA